MTDFIVGSVKVARAAYEAADGAPAEVQGDGSWTVEPLDAVTFGPGPDRLSREVTMSLAAAGWVITAAYDADLRDGEGFVRDLPIFSQAHNTVVLEATSGEVIIE